MNEPNQTVITSEAEDNDANLYRVSPKAIMSGLVVMSMIVGLSVVLLGWVFWHRKSSVVIAMQPEFLMILCFGVILSEFSIVAFGKDETNAANIDRSCLTVVWLDHLGSTLIISALFSKLWRVNQIFHAGETFRRKVVTLKRVLWPFAIFLTLNLICLITVTVVDPPVWVLEQYYGDDGDDNSKVGYCSFTGTVGIVMEVLLRFLNFGALIFLCIQAYKARDIRAEFSEARGVALALFSWLQIMIIAFPMIYLMDETDLTASYVLVVLTVSMQNLSLLLFIFGPLVAHQRKFASEGGGNRLPIRRETQMLGETSGRHNKAGDTAAYELRGAKRRIAELEAQIKALNQSRMNVQGTDDPADVQSHLNESPENDTTGA